MNTLQKYEKYLYIILLVGAVIYFPIFFNGFVWDDIDYIINNPQVHQLNLPVLLGPGVFNSGPFYRPIPAIYFALVYSLFTQQPFFYHFLQLALHLVDTFLLLCFLGLFFSDGIVYFLTLLFLVHPINVESVAFIGSTTSELYFLFGITAFLLATKQTLSRKNIVTISILLLIAVLTKETGVLFLLLILVYRYLFKLNKLKIFAGVGVGIGVIYTLFRVFLGGVTYKSPGDIVPIAALPFLQRMINIPAILTYYIQTFIFPLRLVIWQFWFTKTITLSSFTIPLLACTLFFVALVGVTWFLYKKEYKQLQTERKQINSKKQLLFVSSTKPFETFLFFFTWFVLGMGILLQIVPLDMTVADRWFYFPIVGVLGMIGVGLQAWKSTYQQHQKLFYMCAVTLLIVLSLRTFIRTFDWKDNITLYTHDTKEESDNYIIMEELSRELLQTGRNDDAVFYAKKAVSLYPTVVNLNDLGLAYQHKHQYEKAIQTYTKAIQVSEESSFKNAVVKSVSESVYTNLPAALLLENKSSQATQFINEKALKKYPDYSPLFTLLAIAEYKQHNQQEAIKAASEAYKLSQSDRDASLLNRIQSNLPVNF